MKDVVEEGEEEEEEGEEVVEKAKPTPEREWEENPLSQLRRLDIYQLETSVSKPSVQSSAPAQISKRYIYRNWTETLLGENRTSLLSNSVHA